MGTALKFLLCAALFLLAAFIIVVALLFIGAVVAVIRDELRLARKRLK